MVQEGDLFIFEYTFPKWTIHTPDSSYQTIVLPNAAVSNQEVAQVLLQLQHPLHSSRGVGCRHH